MELLAIIIGKKIVELNKRSNKVLKKLLKTKIKWKNNTSAYSSKKLAEGKKG